MNGTIDSTRSHSETRSRNTYRTQKNSIASNLLVSSSRSPSPTLEALLATVSDSDSDIGSHQSQASITSVASEPPVLDPNLARPAFSSTTAPYHNPRHLGTLPFYYPESTLGRQQQAISSLNNGPIIISYPYHNSAATPTTPKLISATTSPSIESSTPT